MPYYLEPTALVYPVVQAGRVFFDSQDQFLSEIHLPSGIDADAHGGDRFADDATRHGDVALTDCNEQNHRFTKPGRICGRLFFYSVCDHASYLAPFVICAHR